MSSISFIVTTENGAHRCDAILHVLRAAKSPDDEIIVVTPSDRVGDVSAAGRSWFKAIGIANASVFTLRAHVPAIARKDWVVVLEEHSMVTTATIDSIRSLIQDNPDIDLVIFLGKNLTTLNPWEWANFLHTFAFVWAPVDTPPTFSPVTAATVRRSALNHELPMREGEWELSIVPKIFASGRTAFSNSIFIDHIKPLSLMSCLLITFHNARAGAGLSRKLGRPIKSIFREGWYAMTRRPQEMAPVLNSRKHELPAGVLWRLHAVGLVHFIGNVVGGLFGVGQSAHKLD